MSLAQNSCGPGLLFCRSALPQCFAIVVASLGAEAMVIDEQVLPMQRIWCLFEVYHTILLSQNDNFEGGRREGCRAAGLPGVWDPTGNLEDLKIKKLLGKTATVPEPTCQTATATAAMFVGGLLLCTSTGVLQEGRAGTDVAVRVAERARELDTRTAQASNQEDLRMIHVARSSLGDGSTFLIRL